MMDSLRSRKLRPLFERLPSQTSPANSGVTAAFPSCCLAHRAQCMDAGLLPLRGQHWTARKGMDQQARREGSRWNPTKEQLRALEELYARGTRTPQAHQIQLIASQLRRYGRIEGKNVFYWFQNHKARERQRLRRQAEEAATATASDHKQDSDGAAAARAGVLKQESKSWAPAKPCSCTSPATSAAAAGRGEETAYSPWLLLQHQQKQGWAEGDAAWQQTSRHQRPLPCLPRAAATSSSSSSSSSSRGGGDHSNLELSWACRTLSREFAAGEPTTLELFPLSSENNLVGSSLASKPNTSPHVQFFQFL